MPTVSARARKRRNWGATAAVAVVLAGALSWPFAWVEIGTKKAVACVARYRSPRDGRVPDCAAEAIYWFVTPSRVPWTRTPASYRAEELSARIAVEEYLDAAIGHPDKTALGRAGEALDRADRTMKTGSTRIELNELGPAMNAPSLGFYADLVDDRATLVAKADFVLDWKARRHVVATAFEDATDARRNAIVQSYAGMDPRDEDLRTSVGAALCLVGDAKLGMDFLTLVQDNRAIQRHEAMARDFGDTRAGIVACAEKARAAPASKPDNPEAGQLDRPEARAVLRLRTLMARADAKPGELRDASLGVVGLLLEGTRPPGARIALVASLLAAGHLLEPGELATLIAPKWDEAPLVGSLASPFDWLEERRGVVPAPGAATFRKAAARAKEIAGAPSAGPLPAGALAELEAALWIEAARSHAQVGDADALLEALDHAENAFPDAIGRRIVRATALYAAGAAERALAELGTINAGAAPDLRKRAAVLRAELEASLGRRADAAKSAIVADTIDPKDVPDRAELDLRARWTRLALARDQPIDGSAERIAVTELERGLTWPSASLEGQSANVVGAAPEALPSLAHTLSLWTSALAASPADRLAIRYAVLERGGAAPRARVAYLDAAAGLLPKGGGDVEIWLDAFFATDARSLPMRTVAWTRAEAARWRGDATAAKIWDERARRLGRIAATDPELAALVGL